MLETPKDLNTIIPANRGARLAPVIFIVKILSMLTMDNQQETLN